MKKFSFFKQVILQVTFVAAVLLIASCSTHQRAKDTAAASRERSDARYNDTNQTDRDNQTRQTERNNQANRNNQSDSINQTNKNNQTDNTYHTDRNNQSDSMNQTNKKNHTDNTYQTDRNNQTDKSNQTNKDNRTDNANQIDQNNQKDAQFLVNAAEISLEEIQLGQLAQKNGETVHVKELGKMMEDAHTKSLKDLTALAKRKMITIPTSTTDNAKDAYKKLNEKSGNDFDKAYTDRMVSGHKKAITAFEKASADSNDTEIKDWATASLTDLRTHLDHSMDSQKKFNNMYLIENKN